MNIFAYRGRYRTVTGTTYIPGYKSVRLPNMHASPRPGAKPSATLQTDRHAYNARKRELSISLQTRDHPVAFLCMYVCRISRLQPLINQIAITSQIFLSRFLNSQIIFEK